MEANWTSRVQGSGLVSEPVWTKPLRSWPWLTWGAWELLSTQTGTWAWCLRFQLWGRGTAQAAVPPGIRCRFLATQR